MTKKERMFLQFATHITGTKREDIKIISFCQDRNGLFNGIIEIKGHREYIHEYSS